MKIPALASLFTLQHLAVVVGAVVIVGGAGGIVLTNKEKFGLAKADPDLTTSISSDLEDTTTSPSTASNSTEKKQDAAKTDAAAKPSTATKAPEAAKKAPAKNGGTGSTPAPGPTPAPTPAPSGSCPNAAHTPGGPDGAGGCWPYAGNTGVPAGTALSNYSGPCSISSNTVIQNKTVNCALQMYSNASLTIKNSVVNGFIENTYSNGTGKLIIEDSNVNAGAWSDGAIWGSYITANRVNVTGGQHNVHCEDACNISNSWLHDQYNPNGGSYHNNAFLSNGGTNMTVTHNTLHCTAILNATDGGCTGDLVLLGDFAPITYVSVQSNLFMANNSSISYCTYGGWTPGKPYPNAHHVVYQNNVFQRGANGKCGVYGAVTSFQVGAAGNVWQNNKWSDGTILNP